MPTERIVIKVSAEGASTATKEIKGIGDSADRSSKAMTGMRNILAGLITAATIKKLIDYADAWTTITNRIRLVTTSANELKAVQKELLDVSNRTRTDLKSTAELYQRIAMNSKELGLSHRELIDVTETIGQTLAISGASAESANAALVQLSQGLAANALRGQELNSVMEQTPRLAQAIAEGMGISVGELRKIAAEGSITAGVVIDALKNQAGVINEEFAKINPTVGQAMTVANNQIMQFVGQLNDAASGTEWLAEKIIELSLALNADLAIANVNAWFTQWKVTINQVTGEAAGLSNEFQFLGDVMDRFWTTVGDGFKNFPANIKAMTQIATVEITHWTQMLYHLIDEALTKADIAFAKFVQKMVISFITTLKELKLGFREWVKDTFGVSFYDDSIASLTRDLQALQDTWDDIEKGGTTGAYQKELEETQRTIEALNMARTDSITTIMMERDAAITAGEAIKRDILERRQLERQADLTTPLGTPKAGDGAAELTEKEIKKMQQAALAAAQETADLHAGLLDDFQSTLSDSMVAGFKGDTDAMLEHWSKFLLEMATEAMAADIMNNLFPNREGADQSGSAFTLGMIGDLFSSGGASATAEGQLAASGGLPMPGQGIAGADGMPIDPLAQMAQGAEGNVELIKTSTGGLFDWFKEGFSSITTAAGGFIDKFLGGTQEAAATLKTDLPSGIKGVQQASQAANAAQMSQQQSAAAASQAQATSTASAWAPAAQMTSVASFGSSVMMAIAQMLIMSTVMKGLAKFEKGGIVNSPTFFSDNGRASVAGEAGPEAIVPLPDGRSIPVKMAGEKGEGGTTGGGNQTNLNSVNLIDPEMVPALMDTPQGEKAVLNIISNNPDAVSQAVNGS